MTVVTIANRLPVRRGDGQEILSGLLGADVVSFPGARVIRVTAESRLLVARGRTLGPCRPARAAPKLTT